MHIFGRLASSCDMAAVREHLVAKQEFLACLTNHLDPESEGYQRAMRTRFDEMVRVIEDSSRVSVADGTALIKLLHAGPFGVKEKEVLVSKIMAVTSGEAAVLNEQTTTCKRSPTQTMMGLHNFFTKDDWDVFTSVPARSADKINRLVRRLSRIANGSETNGGGRTIRDFGLDLVFRAALVNSPFPVGAHAERGDTFHVCLFHLHWLTSKVAFARVEPPE